MEGTFHGSKGPQQDSLKPALRCRIGYVFPLEKEERSFLADFSIRPKYYFLHVATLLCCRSALSPAFERYFDCVSPR